MHGLDMPFDDIVTRSSLSRDHNHALVVWLCVEGLREIAVGGS